MNKRVDHIVCRKLSHFLCCIWKEVIDNVIYSLFDLKYQINRCGLFAPSEWGRSLEYRLFPLSPEDPWNSLAPRSDPVLLFALTTCGVTSPPIQVK